MWLSCYRWVCIKVEAYMTHLIDTKQCLDMLLHPPVNDWRVWILQEGHESPYGTETETSSCASPNTHEGTCARHARQFERDFLGTFTSIQTLSYALLLTQVEERLFRCHRATITLYLMLNLRGWCGFLVADGCAVKWRQCHI